MESLKTVVGASVFFWAKRAQAEPTWANKAVATLLAAPLLIGLPAKAAPFVLTNGMGEGQVSVGVDGFGSFGSSINGDTASDAIYRPVGASGSSGTVFQSGVALRIGSTGPRSFLSTGLGTNGANPVIAGTTGSAGSGFSFGGLSFVLRQTLVNLFSGTTQIGSRLDQVYTVANTGTVAVSFELVRYLDGDLLFDGSLNDGGGLIAQPLRTLFETDSATGSSDSTTFVGITASGGTQGNFKIQGYSSLLAAIVAGDTLDNTILGDGPDADTFIDAGNGYDVTLGLTNVFQLAPGGTTTYTTQTIFGTGAPAVFVPPEPPTSVPEPGSLAMLGLGLFSLCMLRRRKVMRQPNESASGQAISIEEAARLDLLESGMPMTNIPAC